VNGTAPAVLLRGGGVAIATCAHLLGNDGIPLIIEAMARPTAPVVMLSDPALALLRDVLGNPALFADKPRIARRLVRWGDAPQVELPHGAVVVTGAELERELPVPAAATGASTSFTIPSFTIHGAPPFPQASLRRFGAREAQAAEVTLTDKVTRDACRVEAVPGGWLFLIPQGPERAWLLGVGASLDNLLGASTLVAPAIVAMADSIARFETAPRMIEKLAGDDWLACGTSAIAFDPICGDGTAQAAREAILAAAVVAGLRDGGDAPALLGHYQSMLIASMRRHLQISQQFYATGGTGPWWQEQAAALAQGHAWCTGRLAVVPEPRFVLNGNRLVPRMQAA
jgi:flavin-dependent dehydrogenase